MNAHIVILAAGAGTRTRSARQKVLLEANGLPLIEHVLRAVSSVQPSSTTIVVGHQAEDVGRYLEAWPEVNLVLQDPARGPLHAVAKTEAILFNAQEPIIVVPGAAAAVRGDDLSNALDAHISSGADATMCLGISQNLWGLDVDVDTVRQLELLVEDSAADDQLVRGPLGYSGLLVLSAAHCFGLSTEICRTTPDSADFEGITSAVSRLSLRLGYWIAPDADSLRCPRTRSDIAQMGRILQRRRCLELAEAGVEFIDPETTYVGQDAVVGQDSVIYPNVSLQGRTSIGRGCLVHSGSRIVNSTVADGAVILDHCVVQASQVLGGAVIGPFANLRPDSVVGEGARVGNFVELKKTVLGPGSKANHLSYLGDATIGSRVNIGAGTITCNYDGKHKHQTVIEDDVFIGSDSQLVAPVTIGQGAYVAAGSSITNNVPAGALGIARGRQENKLGWAARAKKIRDSAGHER